MSDIELRDIPGIRDYKAGSDGEIYSLKTGVPYKLSAGKSNRFGYLNVAICQDGTQKSKKVASLVASAFLGPKPDESLEIRHLDGNSLNNKPCNLAYGTKSENERDKNLHGTSNAGERQGRSKLTRTDVEAIRNLYGYGMKQKTIARLFGISKSHVSHIVNHNCWV